MRPDHGKPISEIIYPINAFRYLSEIGRKFHLKTWIGSNYRKVLDRAEPSMNADRLSLLEMKRIIKNTNVLKSVDAIWLFRNEPIYHFEVEERTKEIGKQTIKNKNILSKLFPEIRSVIVGSHHLCTLVRTQKKKSWGYWDTLAFNDLEEFYNSNRLLKSLPAETSSLLKDAPIFQETAKVKSKACDFKSNAKDGRSRHCTLRLEAPKIAKMIKPGQFVAVVDTHKPVIISEPVKYSGSTVPRLLNVSKYQEPYLLRRPLGVHKIYYAGFKTNYLRRANSLPSSFLTLVKGGYKDSFDVLFKIVGRGTKKLSEIKQGGTISVLGPLGNGIGPVPLATRLCYLVAGGIGIAPLYSIAEHLRWLGITVKLIAGGEDNLPLEVIYEDGDTALEAEFSDSEVPYLVNEFKEICCETETVLSLKKKGNSVQNFENVIEIDKKKGLLKNDSTRIYACGPWNMMKAVAEIAKRERIECEVLLEKRMACCIGTCLSCICETYEKKGGAFSKNKVVHKKVCSDGPVFNAREVKW